MKERVSVKDALADISYNVNKCCDNINHGGCAVFASLVYPILKELGLRPVVRVSSFYNIIPLARARKLAGYSMDIDNWYDVGIQFAHVLCEVRLGGERYFYDANGLSKRHSEHEPSCGGSIHPGVLSYEELRSFAALPKWNSMFDRQQIPTMQAVIAETYNSLQPKLEVYHEC